MATIDLNADAGESYGRWSLGDDERLLPLVTSVNVACGYHAGDPGTMRRSVRLAREHGLAVGAHPAFPDLAGFGRRDLAASAEEIADLVAYQVGALAAFCRAESVPLRHVKPHGALYVRAAREPDVLDAIAEAVRAHDPALVLVTLAGPVADGVARRTGVRVAREAYVDLDVDDDGIVLVEARPRHRDAEEIGDRASDAARGRIRTASGAVLQSRVDTICLHGDAPGAVDSAREIRRRLADDGVDLRPFHDLVH
jgi:UPF0271 protein